MIVPKNKQFVIQSVDNFYKLFIMYILNFFGDIYYFLAIYIRPVYKTLFAQLK